VPSLPQRLSDALGDRYRIENELGRGGMAVVYRAHDLKHDRAVALKVLRPEIAADVEASERFLREIRMVARLTHPHILPLYDSGRRGGVLYYVMPLVGESLRTRLEREGALPVEQVLLIVDAVADALAYAHSQDVVHRDIKPENILFNVGHPMVADFGVARAIGADAVTQGGIAVGTPEYMSPEQAGGEAELDGRSDVYSLACVVYEMLCGAPPFQGADARSVMARHITEPPAPVRARRPEVPMGMAAALGRALEKAPVSRFRTAAEFAAALRAVDAAHDAAPRGRIAVLPFVNTSGDPGIEYLSDGITDTLIDALAKVDGLEVCSRTSVFALKASGKDVRAIGAHLHVATVIEGTLRRAGERLRVTVQLTDVAAGRLLWSQRWDRALTDVLAVEDEIAEAIVGTLRRTLLRDLGQVHPRRYTQNVAAYNLYLQGRYYWNRRSAGDLQRAIAFFEQAIAADPEYALAYTGLADCYALQIDYRSIRVREGLERAKAEARRALAIDDNLAEAHTSLAWVLFVYEWDWAGAEREFRRALQIDPRYATAHQWYAWLHLVRGRRNESLAEGHAAADLDSTSVSIRRTLGWLYYHARRHDAAVQHLLRACAMDPTAAENHRILGLVYAARGDFPSAEAACREAVRLSDGSPVATGALSFVLAEAGRTDEARALLTGLRDLASRDYVSPVALGTAYLGLGMLDEALGELERAHHERRGWVAYLDAEQMFDPLRGMPRFEELRRTMGLATANG
jgi:serine/threonine-protein kinase